MRDIIIIFFIATTITTVSLGQESVNNATTTDFKKLQIGINFSPDFCFRTLKNNDGSSISTEILNARNASEIGKLGFTTGLNVVFNLKENLGIEAGIQYSNKGYQTKMQDMTFGSMIDPRHGFVYSSSGPTPIKGKMIHNIYYLDVPLKLNFIFGKRKIRLLASAGVTTNIFLKETTTSVLEYEDGTRDKNTQPTTYNYNKVDISPTVSTGIDWKLSGRSIIRIEPTFRYGILRIIDAPLTGYLWNAGLNIGYYFGLK